MEIRVIESQRFGGGRFVGIGGRGVVDAGEEFVEGGEDVEELRGWEGGLLGRCCGCREVGSGLWWLRGGAGSGGLCDCHVVCVVITLKRGEDCRDVVRLLDVGRERHLFDVVSRHVTLRSERLSKVKFATACLGKNGSFPHARMCPEMGKT